MSDCFFGTNLDLRFKWGATIQHRIKQQRRLTETDPKDG